ncbi:MAG: fibronectin type III domain-containing protein [Dehalococcoidia bacterium]|nr:fibronectin type III domain-containing protein [Dehalococcoidia bacterium]
MTHRINQARTLFLTISLTVVILAALAPSFALAVPQFPAFYHGTVTVVGPEGRIPAPAGSSIGAMVGTYDVTPIKVSVGLAGKYGGPALTDDKLLVQDASGYSISAGDVVNFYDNGVQADESSTFESGKVKLQDLTVNDTEGPASPGNLKRTTEPNVSQPSFTWDVTTDRLSGVSSYAVSMDNGERTWLGSVTGWSAPVALKDGDHTIDVAAKDGVGNVGSPSTISFKIDATIPAVMNPSIAALTQDSAIVTWNSNKPCYSWIDYGLKAGEYGFPTIAVATTLSTSHAVTLTGLLPGVTYHYRIRIKDAQGREVSTGDLWFTTLAPPGPGSVVLTTTTVPATQTPAPATTQTTSPAPGQTTQPLPSTTPVAKKVIDERGVMQMSIVLSSPDNVVRVDISEGVKALDASGKPLVQVISVPLVDPPPFRAGVLLAAYDFQPQGATFSPPVKMTFAYDPAAVPQGYTEQSLKVAFFDSASGSWVELPSSVDTRGHTVSILVGQFSPFAIVASEEKTTTPVPTSSVIDRLIEKAIIAAAALLAFIAALVALIIILRMRRKKAA